jgi:hypothetical protein
MTPEGVTVGLRQSSGAFRALCLLLLAAFLLGGGARGDLQSLMILRPLAAGFLFYGLAKLERHHWAANKPVLGLAFAIIALQVLHLVPLPPAMWSLLPGRDLIVGIDRAAGLGNVWRPLSLAPDATLNGLYASLIPCAALILGLQLAPHERRLLLWPVLLLGGLSALAAIVQLSGGPHGPLYFYRVTNPGAAVGLFANRNHQALLLACLLPALTVWVAGERPQGRTVQFELAGFRKFAAVLAAAAIILLVLVTGSRAGLVLACFAIVSLPVVWPDAFGEMSRNANGKRRLGNKQLLLAAIAVAFIAGMIAIALWRGKGLAVERLFGASPADDMRMLILPELTRLIQFYLPLG